MISLFFTQHNIQKSNHIEAKIPENKKNNKKGRMEDGQVPTLPSIPLAPAP